MDKTKIQIFRSGLVRETGLEPVRAAPHAPQTCASADSATLAYIVLSLECLTTIPLNFDNVNSFFDIFLFFSKFFILLFFGLFFFFLLTITTF